MAKAFTVVNGIGLWNSWTRNFKTPLLACLDLLDNSFDAALSTNSGTHPSTQNKDFQGLIHVMPLNYSSEETTTKSGIRIINNSYKPIHPLVQILEVFRSEKGKHTESVGENGVGLKQGCATLSDVSFVLSKNHIEKKIELGVIAANLQREEGVRLPSFTIKYEMKADAPDEVDVEFMKTNLKKVIENDEGVKKCIEEYGTNNYEKGISELVQQCQSLISSEWGNHAFCVLLTDLRHEKATHLLKDLYEELPKYYIHIPSNFKCKIDTKYIQFAYWQNRLVELSSFKIDIDSQNAWDQENTSLYPKKTYTLTLYLGFDPLRINLGGSCSIYIYSRQSGRLINYGKDARARLGLSASGTNFAQGMTLLVDDRNGNLPLSPSKQDIAFGEEKRGKAHEKNVWAYTAACAHLYWNHNVEKVHGLKRSLGNRVSSYREQILDALDKIKKGKRTVPSLEEMNITQFEELHWYKTAYNNVRKAKVKTPYKVYEGMDTLFKIKKSQQKKQKKVAVKRKSTERRGRLVAKKSATKRSSSNKNKKTRIMSGKKNYYESSTESDGLESDDSVEDIFLSEEVKEWAQKSKKSQNSKKQNIDHEVTYHIKQDGYNAGFIPSIPSQASAIVSRGTKRTEIRRKNELLVQEYELKEQIKKIEEEHVKEMEQLEKVLKEKEEEFDKLESRKRTLNGMMKAMIDSAE